MAMFGAKTLLLCPNEDNQLFDIVELEGISLAFDPSQADKFDSVMLYCRLDELASLYNSSLRQKFVVLLHQTEVDDAKQVFNLMYDSNLLSYNKIENDELEISEHYKLLENLFIKKLGTLSENGLKSSEHDFIWERRNDLQGMTLINSALLWNEVNDVKNYSHPKVLMYSSLNAALEARRVSYFPSLKKLRI